MSDQTVHFIIGSAEVNSTSWVRSGPSVYFFLESQSWGVSMGRWAIQGGFKTVRYLEDYPTGTGCIPVRVGGRGASHGQIIPRKPERYVTVPTESSFQFQIRKAISFLGRLVGEGIAMEKFLLPSYRE